MNDHPEVMHLLFERGVFLGAFTEADPAVRMKDAREASGKGPIAYLTYRKQEPENAAQVYCSECDWCGLASEVLTVHDVREQFDQCPRCGDVDTISDEKAIGSSPVPQSKSQEFRFAHQARAKSSQPLPLDECMHGVDIFKPCVKCEAESSGSRFFRADSPIIGPRRKP